MKKRIALAIAALMVMSVVFASCTATPTTPAPGGSPATPGGSPAAPGGSPGAGTGAQSSYDQLMALLNNPETALPLSGVQPKSYADRTSVPKALPVQPKALKDLSVGWAAASLGSDFFTGMRDSGMAEAQKLGIGKVDLQNANFDLQTQQQQVDTFVTNKVDVMILNAVDLHSSVQMIKTIVAAGIPVLVTGPTAANSDYQTITAVISGSNESGFQVGVYCATKLYKPGQVLNVGMIISKLEDADSNSRPCGWIAGYLYQARQMDGKPYASKYDAILEAYNIWEKYKQDRHYDASSEGLNLAQLGVGNGTSADNGRTAVQDIIVADPGMQLLISEMDSMAVGAIPELENQGKVPGKDIQVVTCADGTITALNMIKQGKLMATATNIPFLNSVSMMDMIGNMFNPGGGGGKTQAEWNTYYNNMPATSFTPTVAVTADNVDQYMPTDPNDPIFGKFARFDPWTPIDIPGYNAQHAND
ncbi:MAG: substrate-binding domain-containing protein [Clostridiales bacterium]|nr:substrate-binding domain-containing protein [Clostridiales bacterium]